jgi:hypothetical protein
MEIRYGEITVCPTENELSNGLTICVREGKLVLSTNVSIAKVEKIVDSKRVEVEKHFLLGFYAETVWSVCKIPMIKLMRELFLKANGSTLDLATTKALVEGNDCIRFIAKDDEVDVLTIRMKNIHSGYCFNIREMPTESLPTHMLHKLVVR